MYLLLSKNITNNEMGIKTRKQIEREATSCNYNNQLQGGKEK